MKITRAHFILYVANQEKSSEFYSAVLGTQPILEVPGMTEFRLGSGAILGLMPVASAARLLDRELSDFGANPKAEIYLLVTEPAVHHARALAEGAREISPLIERDWGHLAAYSYDPDGNVLAFAAEM